MDTTSSMTLRWCSWKRLKVKPEEIWEFALFHLSAAVCVCVPVCVCLPFSAVGETPGLLLPSQLLSSPRRQNILHSARVPHVVHINALYF